MNYLGYQQADLDAAGGAWTAREIEQQPAMWTAIERLIADDAQTLRAFLAPLLKLRNLRIVLTGAGTSAFVGECLAPALKARTHRRVDAVATTDLVGSPEIWLESETPTLLVSFARSGNSPESVAAVTLAEQALPDCHHLIFTCNHAGELNRQAQRQGNAHVVLLPEETNDRGFAMTSSFTGMMLAASLAFDLAPGDRPAALSQWGSGLRDAHLSFVKSLAGAGYQRVVYLGSREFKGLAREAALKMLELSDGRVVAIGETPLGFRHGPKTFVDPHTLVIVFLGNDAHTRRYDMDLVRELRGDGIAARVVSLSGAMAPEDATADDLVVPGATDASDLALCFPFAMFAQSLAFLQSLALGLRPDTPNPRGVVNRVVQGVTIYPWSPLR